MITVDLTGRTRRHLVVLMAITLSAAAVALAAGVDADDRPPLVDQRQVPAGQAAAAQLTHVDVKGESSLGYDVTLTGDGAIPYEAFLLNNPDRLVLDLPGVAVSTSKSHYEISDNGLVRVRVGQWRAYPNPMARVVFELTGKANWNASQNGNALTVHLGGTAQANSGAGTIAPGANNAPAKSTAPAPHTGSVSATTPTPATPAAAKSAEPSSASNTAENKSAESKTAANKGAATESKTAATQSHSESVTPSAASPSGSTPSVNKPQPQPASNQQNGNAATPEPAVATSKSTISTPETKPAAATGTNPIPTAAGRATNVGMGSTLEGESPIDTGSDESPVIDSGYARPGFAPALAESPAAKGGSGLALPTPETKTIEDARRSFNGRPISLNLVDVDIKQLFSVFHEISGLNFVLDPAITGAVTIVVDNVPWDQALDLILKNNQLDMILEGNVVRVAPITKLAQEASAKKALLEAKEFEVAPVSITRTLSYATAKDVEKVVKDAILSPKGKVVTDERTNTLIIRDIPSRVQAIDRLLTTLDAETPQVMIEARIVEVSRDFSRDLGINWGFHGIADEAHGTQTNLDFPHHGKVDFDLKLPRNPKVSSLGFSFGNVLDSFTLDVTIDALETEGYAKRLSAPKIATQNNEPAEIEQGVRFAVFKTTATEIETQFVSASLKLKVTPQITAEGTVVLDLEVQNDSADFVNRVSQESIPSINTQRAKTKVLIPDGGTTVIGGIYAVNEGNTTTGLPWLKNIPGLGWLFKSKSIIQKNRELMIFVTPRIIKAS